MAIELPKEKWSGKIGTLTIGATSEEGGTRGSKVVLGGASTLPFLYFEGEIPNKPVVGMEVLDTVPEDYPELVRQAFEGVMDDPVSWAKKCVEEHGAEIICLKLISTNPEEQDTSPEEAAQTVRKVLDAVTVPLIIYGSGHEEKDAKVIEAVSNETKGERCLLGLAEESAYKSIAVAAQANGHGIVAFSNLDINLAKQMNILLTDFGVKLEDIIMDPLWAGLGYGLEYSYSVIERIRLAAFMGDKILQAPIICDCSVAWKAREAHGEDEELGDPKDRAPFWETTTAISALTAGADLLILRHPHTVELVKKSIDEFTQAGIFGGGE
jgi:acetyl-CoA decarbonylase/synthase complex subunit delta